MTTDDVTFLSADNLNSCPNVRHAFYTRAGGVSGGIYASLNVGIGSQDLLLCVPQPGWFEVLLDLGHATKVHLQRIRASYRVRI